MRRNIGYCKTSEVKLIRTQHIVTFSANGYTTAESIENYIANVPGGAVLIDVDGEDESNIISLVFREDSEEE